MSTWFITNLKTFGMLALGLLAALLVFEAIMWVKKNPISLKIPGSSKLGKEIGETWDKHGLATLKSLAKISVLLVFLNVLCAHTYDWWAVWRNESSLFWTAQFALLFSFYVFITPTGLIPKTMALIVVCIVISGIVKTVNHPRAVGQRQVGDSITVAPSVIHVKAGTWLDLYPSRNSQMHVQPIESGVTCVYMINDDPRQWKSPDEKGNNVDLSEAKLGFMIWKVRVRPVNKDATFLTTR